MSQTSESNSTLTPTTLPEQLCYIFPDRADISSIKLLDVVTNKNSTPEQVALWKLKFKWTDIYARYDRKEEVALQNLTRNLTMNMTRWQAKDGVFGTSRKNQTYKVALKYANDHFDDDKLFFGVHADINLIDWTMAPSGARKNKRSKLKTASPGTSYPLPIPRDLPEEIRKDLEALGRNIPTFANWIRNKHGVLEKYYVEVYEDMRDDEEVWVDEDLERRLEDAITAYEDDEQSNQTTDDEEVGREVERREAERRTG